MIFGLGFQARKILWFFKVLSDTLIVVVSAFGA
jgi:hypothetical protein